MRIGIVGLKADPVQHFHLLIGERARVQHKLDLVLYVPAGKPVDKDTEITDKEIRLLVLEASIADNPFFKASRVELDREGKSYTYDTIVQLRQEHGEEHEYFLVLGEDRADDIVSFYKADELIKLVTFLIAPRKSDAIDKNWLAQVMPAGSKYDTIDYDLSSTFVRQELAAGRSVRYLVPDSAIAKIAELSAYPASSQTAVQTSPADQAATEGGDSPQSETVEPQATPEVSQEKGN